jgi:glucose-1-phosphate thymidylyltransferase
VEKPEKFVSDRAIIGIYYIKNTDLLYESLKYIYKNDIKTRGEYQLTDALEIMLKKGVHFEDALCDKWLDCGKPETLLETNKTLLSLYHSDKKYSYRNSLIIPPVAIEEDAVIENSIIGPYVSVGKGVKIKRSIIKSSIINNNARIENALLEDSLVGDGALLKYRADKVNISDSSELIS